MLQGTAQALVDGVVALSSDLLFPLMFLGLFVAIIGKSLVVFTVRRQWWFAKEFEKRVVRQLEKKDLGRGGSFYINLKRLLERTYYNVFEVRGIMMRRKLDYITSPADRLFAIQHGCALLVRDTLHEVKFLNKSKDNPHFLDVSKSVCSRNPAFGKLFGWIPLGPVNDILNLLPGLYIIGGIFGTFLGIMEALPELSNLNLKDPEGSKLIMDTFLLKISFSISTSIVGIIFSVLLTVFYTMASPEKLFLRVVDLYNRCLTRLWESADSNDYNLPLDEFNEHKDPLEALAHMALEKELDVAHSADKEDGRSQGESGEENKKAS